MTRPESKMQTGTKAGAVIWITGLSGAGKTTLCEAIREMVKSALPELVVLDGDSVRALFGHDLDYSEASRHRQIARLCNLAKLLSSQGQVVMVAALYSHPTLLAENRRVLPNYFEIYLEASLDLVRQRDIKGLYAEAAAGRITDVVGVDIPWHAPSTPDLVIPATLPTADAARQVVRSVSRLQASLRDFK